MSKRKNNRSLEQQPSRLQQTINGLLLASALIAVPSAMAEGNGDNATKRHYHISNGSLSHALSQFAGSAGILLSADARLTDGKSSPGLNGEYTVEEGFQKLLAGSGLVHVFTTGNTVTLKVAEKQGRASPVTLPSVMVTGAVELDANDPYNKSYTVTNSSTAMKTETPIMETPVSIEVVPQEVLKDQQAFRIEDAVKNVSGVQKKAFGGADNFIIRGFDSGRLLFRNGTRIPLLNLDIANIQQIEVLKGPASILFGRIEPGGMINAVTKRPQEDAYYSLEQRFGSYDLYRTEANATGAITDDKSLLYRVDLSYLDTNSFRDNFFDERIFVAPSLTWKLTESTEFNLSYEYLDEDRPFDSGHPAIGKNLGQLPINRQFDQPGLFDNYQNHLVDFNWSHKFNDQWQLRNGVTAMFLDEDWQNTYSGTLLTDNRNLVRRSWFGNRNR